jgi:hypothetical protein
MNDRGCLGGLQNEVRTVKSRMRTVIKGYDLDGDIRPLCGMDDVTELGCHHCPSSDRAAQRRLVEDREEFRWFRPGQHSLPTQPSSHQSLGLHRRHASGLHHRAVSAGEPCRVCGQPLQVRRAMEVGHIFKLDYKYSEALGVTVLDAEGNRTFPIMGSYGIGVERAMSAIVECHHDDKGIKWPMMVAPFQVAVVVAQHDDDEVAKTGEEIYQELRASGVEVIIDDRPERAGVKFRDVELIGIPLRITVGRRGLADGVVEVSARDRRNGANRHRRGRGARPGCRRCGAMTARHHLNRGAGHASMAVRSGTGSRRRSVHADHDRVGR